MRRILQLRLILFSLLYLTACSCGQDESSPAIYNENTTSKEPNLRIGPEKIRECSVKCDIKNENSFLYAHEEHFKNPAGVLHCLVKCTNANCWSCWINITLLQLDNLTKNVTILNISSDFREEDHEMLSVQFTEANKPEIKTLKEVDLLIFGNLACNWNCFDTLLRYVSLSEAVVNHLPFTNEEITENLKVLNHTQRRGLYLWNWCESEESYSYGNYSLQTIESIGLFKIRSLIIHQDVLLHIPQNAIENVCLNPCIPKSLNIKIAGNCTGHKKGVPPSLRYQVWPNLEYLELQLSNLTEESLLELNASLPSLKYLKVYLIWNCETYNSLPDILTSFNWNSLHFKAGVILVCTSKNGISKTQRGNLIRSATLDFLNKTRSQDMVPLEVYMYKENIHPFVVYINMSYLGLDDLPEVTFNMHTNFINLNLSCNNIKSAQIYRRFLLSHVPTIQEPPIKVLDLSHNQLKENTNNDYLLFTQLQELYLSHNDYTVIPYHSLSKQELNWIRKLIPSHELKMLGKIDKMYLSNMLFELRILDLSHNRIHQIDLYNGEIEPTLLPIRGLYFQNNQIDKIPNIVFSNRNILIADLSNNEITFEKFAESLNNVDLTWLNFMTSNIMPTLFLGHNNFTTFNSSVFTDIGYLNAIILLVNFNVHLRKNPLICDCTTYEFYTSVLRQYIGKYKPKNKESLINLDFYQKLGECQAPANLSGLPLMTIPQYDFRHCFQQKFHNCPDKCFCYRDIMDPRHIIVNCTALELANIPMKVPKNTTKLLLSKNSIKSVSNRGYIKTLSVLDLHLNEISTVSDDFFPNNTMNLKNIDLSSNKISTLPKSVMNMQNTKFHLNNNTLFCGCESVWMKDWLMNSTKLVKDWQGIFCISGPQKGMRVIDMNTKYPDCDGRSTYDKDTVIKFAVGIVSVVVVGIILGVVAFWYRGEIKVWLYARYRWHPWDKGDDDIINKDYDAFVSYSQSDVTWVRNELMPFLESEQNQFQLCVHVRDFVPGVTITKNIMTAIDCSRRTILVLSKEFLKSEWCHLEFQAAHQKALQDRSNYLIVILLEDVNPKDLDGSLRLYMKTNTYVNAEDTWFKKKLLYAMPEKPIALLRNEFRVATKPLVLKVDAGGSEGGENAHEFLDSINSTVSYGTWEDESQNADSGTFSEMPFSSIDSEQDNRGVEDSFHNCSDYIRESQRAARRKSKKQRRNMVKNLPPLFRRLLNYDHLEASYEEVEGGYILLHND